MCPFTGLVLVNITRQGLKIIDLSRFFSVILGPQSSQTL